MNLLEEGLATGNVLLTGRKEKPSIDNMTRDFDIYRIKCDFLFYNDQNDRIATWVSEYNSDQSADLRALGRDEYNDVIENFIVESNPAALRKTEKSVALRGQLRPGIVLNDGRVIDGNRRLTCIRRLADVYKRQVYKFISERYVAPHQNLDKWKVFVPAANGSGALGEVLSMPLIGQPLIGHTQSFMSIGCFETEMEADALLKYVKSKFVRTMLGILKITQHNPAPKWKYVPLQDFTPSSDIDW